MRRLALLVLAVGLFQVLTLRQGHDWGDDFAMYIHHAKNLAEGRLYGDTGYIVNPSAPLYAPPVYPPVFPLMLVPIYRARGLDLTAMKLVNVLCFVLSLATIALLFRDELSPTSRWLLIATLGFNPYFWVIKDQVLADLPFLLFVCAALLLMRRRAAHQATSPSHAVWRGVLLGFVIYLAYGTRTVGLVLLPCLVLQDLIGARRVRRESVVALVAFAIPAVLQHVYLPSGGSYYSLISLAPSVVARQAVRYADSLRLLWLNGHSALLLHAVIAATALLAVAGLVGRLRSQVTVLEIFVLLYPLPVVTYLGAGGVRYLIPLVPFYLFYALWAVDRLGRSRPLAARAVLVAWLAMIGLSYGLRYPGMHYGSLREGIGVPATVELFDYIRTQTPASAVFVFRKPRALSLFGERAATIYHEARSDDELWDFLTRIHATHLVVGRLEPAYWKDFVARKQPALEVAFANAGFTVYRVARIPRA